MLKPSPIITITTTINGDILSNNYLPNNPFKDCKNIYEINELLPYKNELINCSETRRFAINIFEKNYIIAQQNQQVLDISAIQFLLMEFCSDNVLIYNPYIRIINDLCDIKGFTMLEQEIIFVLVNGLIQDKEIISFLTNLNRQYTQRNILYNIQLLYQKFQVNSRSILIQSIKAHRLDAYIPISILRPGLYSSLVNLPLGGKF